MPKTATAKEPHEILKDLCPLFAAVGVTKVEGEYDGSGDSGDFNTILFRFDDSLTANDRSLLENSTVRETNKQPNMYLDLFKNTYCTQRPDQPPPLILPAILEQFETSLWDLLPGGWEINEGSFGTIVVDVVTKTVRMEHNERITEINSTTSNW